MDQNTTEYRVVKDTTHQHPDFHEYFIYRLIKNKLGFVMYYEPISELKNLSVPDLIEEVSKISDAFCKPVMMKHKLSQIVINNTLKIKNNERNDNQSN